MNTREYVKNALRLILLISPLLSTINLSAQNIKPPVNIRNSEQFYLRSDNTTDSYLIQVCLPDDYDSSGDKYPVMIVLDGDKSTGMARDIAFWLMFREEIENIIIVGISYGGDTETWWNKRARDFTPTFDDKTTFGKFWPQAGGAKKFISFLEDELIPVLKQDYHISDEKTGICGFSYGGLLATYILFYRPLLFENYLIVSPALVWDNNMIMDTELKYSMRSNSLDKKVYLSRSENDPATIVKYPVQDFLDTLAKRDYFYLKLQTELFEGDSHFSSYPKAFTNGLIYLYKKK